MKTLIPRKAPELLCDLLDEGHGYAVNCSFPNSLRIMNRSQYEILKAVNGRDDLQTLAGRLSIECETLHNCLVLMAKM